MKFRRITALILSIIMVLGMLPFSAAFAQVSADAAAQAQAQADPNAEPELTSDKVVFVSGYGDDSDNGDSEDAPVKTLTKAIQLLGSDGGTVVVCGEVKIEDEPLSNYEYTPDGATEPEVRVDGRFAAPAHTGLVYITASYGGVDYADAGAKITFGSWVDHANPTLKAHHYILGGPTTFENIHFDTYSNPVFYGRGHFITMGEGITSGHALLVLGYDQGTDFTKGEVRSTDTDTHIIIKSGSYSTISGMTRQTTDGAYVGTAYITVENADNIATLAGLSVGATGGYFGNSVIKINGGKFGTLVGAAYNSTHGIHGDVSLTINNATVTGRLGGIAWSGSYNAFGNVTTVVNAGAFNTLDGYSYGTKHSTFGNSSLTVNGGSYNYIDGVTMGDTYKDENDVEHPVVLKSSFGSATTTINGGTVTEYVCGGSYRNDFTAHNVTLNMNADVVYEKAVCGLNVSGDATVNGDVTVNISKGTYNGYVCALSYGGTVSGKPSVYINVSGGNLAKSGASLMLVYKLSKSVVATSDVDVTRAYYNVSGGSIDKIYIGARYVSATGSAPLKCGGMYFTYSGGSIGTISTAWLTGYHKYYFAGDKTYETTTFACGKGGQSGWPAPGDNAFNYVNIGSEYPDAVYLTSESSGGDYANNGLSADKALQSVYDAAVTLGPGGGTIYLLNDIGNFQSPKLDGTLTFSGILPGTSEPNGKGITFDSGNLYLNSNTVFDGVNFRSTQATRLMAFQGHDVTVNANCTSEISGAGAIELVAGYSLDSTSFVLGGKGSLEVSVTRDQTITINAGEWIDFYGGNKRHGQYSSVGTYYGDVEINIGAGATFKNNTPEDDVNPAHAVFLTGMNIVKGSVTANLAGTFDTPVYAVARLGVYFNGVSIKYTESADKEVTRHHIGTDGLAIWKDTKYEADITVNASGSFIREGGKIDAICVPGDTPVYGSYTLDTANGSFASGFVADAKGIIGNAVYTGNGSVNAVNFDKVNGVNSDVDDPVRVITVGDSITWGTCAANSTVDGYTYNLYNNNYPMQLQKLLGENAVVGNYGYPGAHAYYSLFNDYFGSPAYGMSLQFGDADAVIIALGTNDNENVATDGVMIEEGAGYYLDSMRRLIETYHAAYPDAVIYITTALPRWTNEVTTNNTYKVVIPLQQQLAGEYSYTRSIDLFTAMKPYADKDQADDTKVYFADKLHPTNEGYTLMANAVYEGIRADLHRYKYSHTDATCTTSGYDEYLCVICSESYKENYVEPTGHDLYEYDRMDATTSSEGYVDYACYNCDFSTRETLPIVGKTYTRFEVIAPTCTDIGYTRHFCDQDDSYYDDTFIDALGHDEIEAVTAATCHAEGSKSITCSRCDYSKTETIPKLEHVPGDEATCLEPQKCTLCSDVLVEALGHDEALSVTAPTAHTAGYTFAECGRCGHSEKRDWTDATDGIVVFVDTANGKADGDGTLGAPFNTYTAAVNYANRAFDRTIVLMSMVAINSTYTEQNHSGHYTVTSSYGGKTYGGGIDVNGTSHYLFGGDVTFENLTIDIEKTSVWRARYNKVVFGDGVVCTGKAASGFYVVGGDQLNANAKDNGKGTYLEFRSGTFFEIIGGHRSCTPQNAITGDIHIYFGGTATTEKIFISSRDAIGAAPTGNAVLKIDGGIINLYVGATTSKLSEVAKNTPTGDITVYVTENFVVENSFTKETSGIFRGISVSNVFTANAKAALPYINSARVEVDWRVYGELKTAGFVNADGCHDFVSYGTAGDFDGDSSLTNSDVTLLVRHLAGWDTGTRIVDITADGKVNNRDAILLVQKIAGWEE